MGESIALSGMSSYQQLKSSLTCSSVAIRPPSDAYVSRYNGFLTSQYFMQVSSFTSDVALSYTSWCDLSHIKAALMDVSLL